LDSISSRERKLIIDVTAILKRRNPAGPDLLEPGTVCICSTKTISPGMTLVQYSSKNEQSWTKQDFQCPILHSSGFLRTEHHVFDMNNLTWHANGSESTKSGSSELLRPILGHTSKGFCGTNGKKLIKKQHTCTCLHCETKTGCLGPLTSQFFLATVRMMLGHTPTFMKNE
jgi:hypothetical protein